MNPAADQQATVQLPEDVLRSPSGQPAAVLVRTHRGWTVLGAEDVATVGLVEGMSLADLVAGELGATPEPDREARRAARNGTAAATEPAADDPRDEEIAALRRTIGQLEHALAARVSIERAIGVLAERHGSSPREAFEQLRHRARSEGRPAQALAAEVLGELPGPPSAVTAQRTAPVPKPHPVTPLHAANGQCPQRHAPLAVRRADDDAVREAQS